MRLTSNLKEYLTSLFYTKEEVNEAIGNITQFDYQLVDHLPETGVKGTIYLITNQNEDGDNLYNGYLYVNGGWELIGPSIDLTGYSTKEEVKESLKGKVGFNDTVNSTVNGLMTPQLLDKLNNLKNTIVSAVPFTKSVKIGEVDGTSLYCPVDDILDDDSTYPVQNKVVDSAINSLTNTVNGKAETIHTHNLGDITNLTVATVNNNGLMSSEDKNKLNGVSEGANKTIIDDTLNNNSVNPVQNKIIKNALDGKADNTTATTNKNGLMSHEDKIKLDGITTGAKPITIDSALDSNSTNPVQNKVVKNALDGKADQTEVNNKLESKASTSIATTSSNGLMSSADKTKLEGIETGANKTIVDNALKSDSVNPVQNKVVKSAIDGKANSGHNHDDKYYTETEIDSKLNSKAGTSTATQSSNGLMSSSDKKKLDGITDSADAVEFSRSLTSGTKIGTIKINGTSTDLYSTNDTTYNTASQSANGLMSKDDKKKLDGIGEGANKTTVDTTLSASSTNPVQNKAVQTALNSKANTSHTHKTLGSETNGNYKVDNNDELGIAIITWWTHGINVTQSGAWKDLATFAITNKGNVVYTNSVLNGADGTVYFRINKDSSTLQYNASKTGNLPIQPGQLICFIK